MAAVRTVAEGGSLPPFPDGLDCGMFWKMARRHNLAGMVCHAVEKCGIPLPHEIRDRFRKEKKRDIVRALKLMGEAGKVFKILERAEIPFVPLKGCLIRKLYPLPEMRTMGDVDILLQPKDLGKVGELIVSELGFREGSRSIDGYLYRKDGAVLETHDTLFKPERIRRTGVRDGFGTDDLWQRLEKENGWEYRLRMSDEDFLASFLIHFAQHFVKCGLGARFVLDYWFLRKNGLADLQACGSRLERLGLLELAQKIGDLSELWFGGAEPYAFQADGVVPLYRPDAPVVSEPNADGGGNPPGSTGALAFPSMNWKAKFDNAPADILRLEKFILSSGLFGVERNIRVLQFCERVEGGADGRGRFLYLVRSVFPSRSLMAELYPSYSGKAFFYPFYWLALVKRRLGSLSRYLRKIAAVMKMAPREANEAEELMRSCGLGRK